MNEQTQTLSPEDRNTCKRHILRAVFVAFAFSGLIAIWNLLVDPLEDSTLLKAKIAYGAAALLVYPLLLSGTHFLAHVFEPYATRPRRKNPYFWLHGFYMGLLFFLLMVILQYKPEQNFRTLTIGWMAGAIMFGVTMAYMSGRNKFQEHLSAAQYWDIENFHKRQPGLKKLVLILLPSVLSLMIVHYAFDSSGNLRDFHDLVFFVVLVALNGKPIFPQKGKAALTLSIPVFLGFILLLTARIAFG